ncbi:MAG: Cof-type HAD-IIB family hydrolase [Erysipelotrichaceae bacterium]|nr:Cof-type HAD-IIB family hydrolase [Erysipelotrichaceae bacterium]
MIKVIFFDLDGTVLSHTGVPVLDSTREALRLLKEKGIKRICCTGRNIGEMEGIKEFDLDFDGYYTDNGQGYFDEELNPVEIDYLNEQQTQELVSFFNMKIVPTMLATSEKLILNCFSKQVLEVTDELDIPTGVVGTYNGERLLNGVAYVSRKEEEQIRQYLPNAVFARWNPYAVDIVYNAGGKAEAIEKYISKHNLSREETMAFGDSFNDESMLKAAGYGVAMGNAVEELKKVADYVAPDIDDDGIYRALKHLKLI